jgi:hypothetical protein
MGEEVDADEWLSGVDHYESPREIPGNPRLRLRGSHP